MAALHRAVALEQVARTLPCVSANTWISMWRGRVRYFSTSTRSSPKLDSASRLHEASAASKSALLSTMRMPLPPPPALALMQHRIADASAWALQKVRVLVVAVIAGHERHPGLFHQRFAADFEPMAWIASTGGPMKATPASAQAAANPSFSDRKP